MKTDYTARSWRHIAVISLTAGVITVAAGVFTGVASADEGTAPNTSVTSPVFRQVIDNSAAAAAKTSTKDAIKKAMDMSSQTHDAANSFGR
jgi:hypothetical protein